MKLPPLPLAAAIPLPIVLLIIGLTALATCILFGGILSLIDGRKPAGRPQLTVERGQKQSLSKTDDLVGATVFWRWKPGTHLSNETFYLKVESESLGRLIQGDEYLGWLDLNAYDVEFVGAER